jgi:hypothetical protein
MNYGSKNVMAPVTSGISSISLSDKKRSARQIIDTLTLVEAFSKPGK